MTKLDTEHLFLALRAAREQDWPEDFGCEDGHYTNICAICGVQFLGHVRRRFCRLHAGPGSSR